MKLRFESDVRTSASPSAELVDPEAYDASEQQFAASLEETSPRFVAQAAASAELNANPVSTPSLDSRREASPPPEAARQTHDLPPNDSDVWRQEVASRLSRYRARRRAPEPRYPSLQLKFEAAEPPPSAPLKPAPAASQASAKAALPVQVVHQVVRKEERRATLQATDEPKAYAGPVLDDPAETTARIIPFPRSAVAPPWPLEELAGPVLERPRILEVPEVAPPPPALGGILIEPAEDALDEDRLGIDLPLHPARMWRRLLAGGIDGLLTTSACALFAYMFFRITATVPPPRQAAEAGIALAAVFWMAYQYSLLVHTGTTPGLRLARLRLARFDGSAVPRRLRRWRVLASVLSAVSLGLGYAWCVLDQDELCWHDRITGTYLAPPQ